SAAVSTSTGRLIDSIANADTVRSFAKAAFERRLLAHYLDEEARRSIRLRWFLTMMRLFQVLAVIVLLGVMVWLALRATHTGPPLLRARVHASGLHRQQRLEPVEPHARLLRADRHADRGDRTGDPAARDRRPAGRAAAGREPGRHRLPRRLLHPSRRLAAV